MNSAQDSIELEIKGHLAQKDYHNAVTIGLRAYGPEILGFLIASERDESSGSEAFSDFCEDLWKGITQFRGEASFRTWSYTLARNAAYRRHRDPYRRHGVPLSQVPELLELIEEVRTSTLMHLRTEVRDQVTRLRDRLDSEDRDLLILRVDRKMSWNEIAQIFERENPTEKELRKRSAALRKRFERIKERLRDMAIKEGLISKKS